MGRRVAYPALREKCGQNSGGGPIEYRSHGVTGSTGTAPAGELVY